MCRATLPLCMTLLECMCSSALQSWTKYFHTVLSGMSLLCFLKCCSRKTKTKSQGYIKMQQGQQTKDFTTNWKKVQRIELLGWHVRFYVFVEYPSPHTDSTPNVSQTRLSSVPCISKFCLIFSAAYNGKHMHSPEQRKRNLWCLLKLHHLAHRTLVALSPQWQNGSSCFQSLCTHNYLEG